MRITTGTGAQVPEGRLHVLSFKGVVELEALGLVGERTASVLNATMSLPQVRDLIERLTRAADRAEELAGNS